MGILTPTGRSRAAFTASLVIYSVVFYISSTCVCMSYMTNILLTIPIEQHNANNSMTLTSVLKVLVFKLLDDVKGHKRKTSQLVKPTNLKSRKSVKNSKSAN